MESIQKTSEKVFLERELNELVEVTFRMEHELELLLQKQETD